MVSTLPFTKTISLSHHDTMSWWMKVTMTIWFDDLGYFQATKLTIPRSTSSFQFCTLWIAVPKKIEHDRTVISHHFSMILLFYLFELFFSTPLRESLVVFELLHQENAPSQLTFINETHPPILPPVRDGDSDSTTTPGTDFPWKLAKRAPGWWDTWEVPWLGVAESPTNEILNWLGKGYERIVEWCSMGDFHWFSICNGARWDIQLVSWQVMFFCSNTDVHFGYMKKYVPSHWIWT